MKIIQKTLSIILIFILLAFSLPIETIVESVVSADDSIKTIDLTNIQTGTDAEHTHVYEQKYDDNIHWQECFICHAIVNRNIHNLVKSDYSYGYASCNPTNIYTRYCADGCGYSVTQKDPCTANGTWYTESMRYLHTHGCIRCGEWVDAAGCTDANGRRISCQNLGRCVVCGYNYTNPIHHISSYIDGYCEFCHQQFIELVSSDIRYTPDYSYATIEWRLRGVNGGIVQPDIAWYTPEPATAKQKEIIRNGYNDYTYRMKITFDKGAQSYVSANFATSTTLTINGQPTFVAGFYQKAYYDHIAPTSNYITVSGNGESGNYSTKAYITASVRDNYSDTIDMRLLDTDGRTVLLDWGAAVLSNGVFTRNFDIVAEVRQPSTVYVESRDRMGNISTQAVTIQYVDTKPPVLIDQWGNTTNWTRNKQITYVANDKGIGQVQIGFNNQNDFQLATQNGDNYTRTYNFIGDVYGTVTCALYLKDGLNNIRTEKVTISNIDNTAPTITNIREYVNSDRRTANLVVDANDINTTIGREGSGINGYQITRNNTTIPTEFQPSNTFTITQNGTYYLWVRDAVGNVSKARQINIVDLEIELPGNITWNDDNNKYNSRVGSTVKLYRKIVGGQEEYVAQQNIVPGQTNYKFQTRQCDNNGNVYEFRVEQDKIPGYETIIEQRNISNNLILPNYISELKIEPKNSFENKYLKNGQVKLEAIIQADSNNTEEVGVHTGTIQLQVDNKINIDIESITILLNQELQTYTIAENVITLPVAKTKAGDKIQIYLEGTLKELGNYNSNITYTGNLIDYRNENTNINLGVITSNIKEMVAEYQLPEANIQFVKKDSITQEELTNAEFTLYEWNGEEYSQVEKITDENQDGIYESKIYRWNHITQGKYKLVETTIPQYHTNIEFDMEYSLNQLKTQNYTITTDYSNEEYKIKYNPREPDEFKRQDGIVENEPWKAKISINKVDIETKNIIQNKAEFTVYEWNKETNLYEKSKVTMEQQEDKTYLSSNWIYYTQKNEGKFAIVETKAPFGYYGDYKTISQKNIHYIDLVKWIESEEGENEATISLGNTQLSNLNYEENQFVNSRVKASILAKLIDSQTKENAQGDATLEGAVYGLYAFEEIYHADGVTTRYEEPGLLYKKDELVQIQTSNKKGEIVWKDIECGKYYIKMIQAPNGYMLDTKKYKVDLDYETEEKSNISQTGKIQLDVKKQAFELYKINEKAEDLANAGFSIYKINELSIVKQGKIVRKTLDRYELKDESAKKDKLLTVKANEDGTYMLSDLIDYYYKIQRKEGENEAIPGDEIVYNTYNLENEQLAKDYSNYNDEEDGRTQIVKIKEIRTNEKGYMKSPKLAYGEYIVIETSVPRKQNNVPPFVIQITENSEKPQTLKYVVDKNFRTKLKIYVKDAKTKETIINNKSAYIIKNVKTNKLQTYTIKENGKEITYGTKENPFIIGKDGYLETPMELEIGEYIIEQLVAPIGYVKNGEEGYSENGIIQKNPREKIRVTIRSDAVYHVNPETGAYVIVAEQTNEEILGNIKITAQGEFLSNAQTKQEETSLEYTTRKIEGSNYELIAKEDITTQDGRKTIIYKKGDKVTSFITKGEQEVILENLPQGQYEIKQTHHAQGFADKKNQDEITIEYKGQETAVVEEKLMLEEQRQKVKITIYNKDSNTKKAVKGGIYGLYTKEEITYINNNGQLETILANTLIAKTEANIEGKIEISAELNKDIPQGKYYLKELQTPQGYTAMLENITIDATTTTGEPVIIRRNDNIKEKTKIKIKSIDKNGNALVGGKIEIMDNETIVASIDKIEEINEIEGLEIEKKYTIRKTPITGYATGEKIEFSITKEGKLEIAEKYMDKQDENTIIILNETTKLKIVIKDKETKENIEGIELEIKNEEGKTLTKLVQSEEKGTYYIQKLPVGKYKIIETKIPYDKGYVEKQVIEIKVEDNKNWQEVIIEQERSKVLIRIEDEETKEIVKNAQIVIRKKDTKEVVATTGTIENNKQKGNQNKLELKEDTQNILSKIEETDKGYVVTKLPVGNYEIIEKVPDGYKQIGIVDLKVKDTKEWQNTVIQNRKLIFSMEINKEVEEIRANGKRLELPKNSKLYKIEIRNKDVKTDKIEIQYKIQVKNTGEIEGTIGTIIDIVPKGLEYVETEKGLWEVVGTNLICNKYNSKILKPGETQEVEVTLRWKNSETNFGEKKNIAELKGSSNYYNYPNQAGSTNSTTQLGESSVSVIISLRTGIEYKITAIRIGLIVLGLIFVLAILIISEIRYLKRA